MNSWLDKHLGTILTVLATLFGTYFTTAQVDLMERQFAFQENLEAKKFRYNMQLEERKGEVSKEIELEKSQMEFANDFCLGVIREYYMGEYIDKDTAVSLRKIDLMTEKLITCGDIQYNGKLDRLIKNIIPQLLQKKSQMEASIPITALQQEATPFGLAAAMPPIFEPLKENTYEQLVDLQRKLGQESEILPRVYIHYYSKESLEYAKQLQGAIIASGYIAPSIRRDEGPKKVEFRYFKVAEKDMATKIYQELLQRFPKETAKFEPKLVYLDYEKSTSIRPLHFEIWLP